MNEENNDSSETKLPSTNTEEKDEKTINEDEKTINEDNSDESDDSEIFQIEKIVGCKYIKKKKYFKIRWQGYGSEEDTWEPESNLIENVNLLEMVNNYSKLYEMDKKQSNVTKKPKKTYIEESLSEGEDWFGIKPDEKSRETRRLYVADRIPSVTEKILAEIDPGVRVLRNHLRESIPGININVKNLKNESYNNKKRNKKTSSNSSDEEKFIKKKRFKKKKKSHHRKSILKTNDNPINSSSITCLNNNNNISNLETSDALLEKTDFDNETKSNIQKTDQPKNSCTNLINSKIKNHVISSSKDNKKIKQKSKNFPYLRKKIKKLNDESNSNNTDNNGKISENAKSKSNFLNLNKIKKNSPVTSIVDSLLPFSSLSNDLDCKFVNNSNKKNLEKFSTTKLQRINKCYLPILVNFQEINTLVFNEKILEANQN